MIDSRRFRRGFAIIVFFTVLAGDAWRYSITWFGYAAVVLAITAVAVILLVRRRDRWRVLRLPLPLLGFVGLTVLSTAWSDYPLWTGVAALTTVMTVTAAIAVLVALSVTDIVRALSAALRIILGLSLLFELFVSAIIRHPVLPWWANYHGLPIHAAYYWSRDLLFTGDRIQGIVGNSNLLGFVALLGLIVFGVRLAARTIGRGWGTFWIVVALACLALTRSATVTVATVAVAAVVIVIVLLRRAATTRGRVIVAIATLAVVAVGVVGVVLFQPSLLALFGKDAELTGRTVIWQHVIHLAQQRPVFGWGWISYWVPFVPPFNTLAFNGGVQLLQAHNAWLDVWLQLGIVGLVVFGVLVLTTLVNSWRVALDRPPAGSIDARPRQAVRLLPLLILAALLAQSLAESRLLLEYGMLLLTICAVVTKPTWWPWGAVEGTHDRA